MNDQPPPRTPEQLLRARLVRHYDKVIGPGEVFTVQQLSPIFHCSIIHVLELIRNQKIVAFNIGKGSAKHWRIHRAVLLRWLADNSNFTQEMLDKEGSGGA